MAVLDKQGEIQEFLKGDGFWMARQCNAQTHSVHDSEYALDLIAAYGSFTWAKGLKYFKCAAGRPTCRVVHLLRHKVLRRHHAWLQWPGLQQQLVTSDQYQVCPAAEQVPQKLIATVWCGGRVRQRRYG